jgi:uncharacterized delta-60 repeat protein
VRVRLCLLPSLTPRATSFGSGGWALTDVGKRNNHNIPHGVAVQRDGRILATGNSLVPYWLVITAYSFATVRYDVDGSLDASFGDGGRVVARMGTSREDDAHTVLVLSDGRIVVAGTADSRQNVHCEGTFLDCLQAGRSDFSLARYLPNGQLDKSFGRNGRTGPFGLGWATTAYTAALDSHDRVLVGGFGTLSEDRSTDRVIVTRAPAIVRYNADGSLDQSFGQAGVVLLEAGETAIAAVAVQLDAKIVAVGLLRTGKCGSCGPTALCRLGIHTLCQRENHGSAVLAGYKVNLVAGLHVNGVAKAIQYMHPSVRPRADFWAIFIGGLGIKIKT